MLRFGMGKVGSGKGIFYMHRLETELVHTNFWCVGNMEEILLDKLQVYLWKKHGKTKRDLDLNNRYQAIHKLSSHEFYRFRGDHTLLPFPQFARGYLKGKRGRSFDVDMLDDAPTWDWWAEREKFMTREEKDAVYSAYFLPEALRENAVGVTYFIDEGHRFFKAEDWNKMSGVMTFYMLHMRHLNDRLWILTQWPELVNISMRRAAEDSFLMHNFYRETFMFWQKPGSIRWTHFYGVPETKEKNPTVIDDGQMYIEKDGLASCYLTRGALGGKSTSPEGQPVQRKLPFWTIWPISIGLGCLVVAGMWGVPKAAVAYFRHVLTGSMVEVRQKMGQAMGEKQAPSISPVNPGLTQAFAPSSKVESPQPETKPLPRENKVASYMQKGNDVILLMEDGTVVHNANGEIRGTAFGKVYMKDGTKLPMISAVQPHNSKPEPELPMGDFGGSGTLSADTQTELIREEKTTEKQVTPSRSVYQKKASR